MNLLELLALNLLVTLWLMTALWSVSLILRDVSIVDVFWGLGFIVIAAVTFFLAANDSARKLLLLGLTAAWGLRLSIHLAVRKCGSPVPLGLPLQREVLPARQFACDQLHFDLGQHRFLSSPEGVVRLRLSDHGADARHVAHRFQLERPTHDQRRLYLSPVGKPPGRVQEHRAQRTAPLGVEPQRKGT